MSPHLLELLRRLETAEVRLLTWGCVDGAFEESEVLEHARQVIRDLPESAPGSEDELLDGLVATGWLWRLPGESRYRSRMAEAVRLFARLRQMFPPKTGAAVAADAWRSAPMLVADYRLLVRPRRFPKRDLTSAVVLQELALPDAVSIALIRAFMRSASSSPRSLARFQVEATRRILGRVQAANGGGTIVCAGTGSGKTLAFYLPAFLSIARTLKGGAEWTRCLAIYPRNELLKDQLREALANTKLIKPVLATQGLRPISIGALYGDVPKDPKAVEWGDSAWPAATLGGKPGRVCPYIACSDCNTQMIWRDSDRQAGAERLICRVCKWELGPDDIRLTRASLLSRPPDILFTSTEMLNQRLSQRKFHRLFGIGVNQGQQPQLMLLDEVHTYEGGQGAHVALLLRRWRALARAKVHTVGLSATLEDAARFFSDLTGVPASLVAEVAAKLEDSEEAGAEYQLAIRGDPSSQASLLSTSIQGLMLLRRILGQAGDVEAGSRVFAFTDNLDVVNRLFHNLVDAEGRSIYTLAPKPQVPLASLRSPAQPQHDERFVDGQSWDLVESLGHTLGPNNRLDVRRTTSQDQGVDAQADVVVATSSLEVGFDDARVGAVLQHKAPRNAASFLQRKGRAGRIRSMRPWTVVALSDFGRDRSAYQMYEQLFSPTLSPRYLPIGNRALLRMQATYVLFEWLSSVLPNAGLTPWFDLAHPGEPKDSALRERQSLCLVQLQSLLDNESTQKSFADFVGRSLQLEPTEVQALLWEPPRAVLLEAVPTLVRRLETHWELTDGTVEPSSRYGPPLPDFVQRNLFGELLVPEVTIEVPKPQTAESMLIAPALREFAPGRVSRRFGVKGGVNHWIDPGSGPTLDVATFCSANQREWLGQFQYLNSGAVTDVDVFRPFAFRVTSPPANVKPNSNAFLVWRSQILPTAIGHSMDVPANSRWGSALMPLGFHTHHLGAPVQLRRFSTSVRAEVKRQKQPSTEVIIDFCTATPSPTTAGLGFATEVDAVEVRFNYPKGLHLKVASSSELLRTLRPARVRDLFKGDPRLDGVMNSFQRDQVSEAFLAAVALEAIRRPCSTADSAKAVLAGSAVLSLQSVLQRIALWADDSESPVEEEGATGAQPATSGAELPQRLADLLDATQHTVVWDALSDASAALVEDISQGWEGWLARRLKGTLAAAFLEAVLDACPQVQEEDLLADLDADLGPPSGADDRFWITETSPGGTGALESFYRTYAQDPRRFFRRVEAQLEPSDWESIASNLERLVVLASGPELGAVPQALAAVRRATTYTATLAAVSSLRLTLAGLGILPSPSLMVSVNARVLKPGTSPGTDAYLARTLKNWSAAEVALGMDLDVRVFALAVSEDTEFEQVLGLTPPGQTDAERATWRYSNLRGLLWARGGQLRREALRTSNPFSAPVECDRLLAQTAWTPTRLRIEVASADWFHELESALTRTGTVELAGAISGATELTEALLSIGVQSVDTGAIRVHARLTGVRREGSQWIATFELPEAFQ